jgi:hypothetical protein
MVTRNNNQVENVQWLGFIRSLSLRCTRSDKSAHGYDVRVLVSQLTCLDVQGFGTKWCVRNAGGRPSSWHSVEDIAAGN